MSAIPHISIIIPCYNCEKTLGEAVDSCFDQGLSGFEIVMVDDGSTDGTKALMEKIAREHPEVRVFFHEKNRGGGAARNTAVSHTMSDVIFCLDSDDILPSKTLHLMLSYLREKSLDGVGFEKCVKFNGSNPQDVERVEAFAFADRVIPLESLFDREGNRPSPLYMNFMYTRAAFDRLGGYPDTHGFDTQGFAWRFLLARLRAGQCPGASYLQRVNFNQSYYLREYESGKANRNWFEIFSESLWVFSEDAKERILSYDLLDPFSNIFDDIQGMRQPFAEKASDLSKPRMESAEGTVYDRYWRACQMIKAKRYGEAEKIFVDMRDEGRMYPSIEKNLEICELGLRGLDPMEIQAIVSKKETLVPRGSMLPFHRRIIRGMRKLLRKFMHTGNHEKK